MLSRFALAFVPISLVLTLGSAFAIARPAAAAEAQTAGAGTYWICRFSYYSQEYVSDVIGPTDDNGAGMGELVKGFRSFLAAKYKLPPTGGSATCIYQFSAASAQAILKTMITPAGGQGAVPTGWKPGMQPGVAAANTGQPSGVVGPDGVVIGGTTSGVPTSYYCYLQYIFPNAHRQTSFTSGAFTSTEAHVWITFYWSQYIHDTYHIPPKVSNITVGCAQLAGNPAQQQAVIINNINSWKMHDNDVVQVNWVPNKAPIPGVSGAQIDVRNALIVNQQIGSNLPPASNPAGSAALCGTNSGEDGTGYISAIFDPANHTRYELELAFSDHLRTTRGLEKVASCIIHPSLAKAQAMLQAWKQQASQPGAKVQLVETGWVYQK